MKTKIYHWHDWQSNTTKIVFFQLRGVEKFAFNPYSGISELVKEGGIIPKEYIMSYPGSISEFISAFTETIDDEKIKTNQELRNEGILSATMKHLEDMRKIAFSKINVVKP